MVGKISPLIQGFIYSEKWHLSWRNYLQKNTDSSSRQHARYLEDCPNMSASWVNWAMAKGFPRDVISVYDPVPWRTTHWWNQNLCYNFWKDYARMWLAFESPERNVGSWHWNQQAGLNQTHHFAFCLQFVSFIAQLFSHSFSLTHSSFPFWQDFPKTLGWPGLKGLCVLSLWALKLF